MRRTRHASNNTLSPSARPRDSALVSGVVRKAVLTRPPFVVGIGASAAGIEAIATLLRSLSSSTLMAFVVVGDVGKANLGASLQCLSRATSMAVLEAVDGAMLERDHVYLVAADAGLLCRGGRFQREERRDGETPMPIDAFLRSLARDRRSRSIGVILAGAGSDGTYGVQAIKAYGGVTFAQDVRLATPESMPLSAISTGCIDFMLPPEEIGAGLHDIEQRLRAAYGAPTMAAVLAEESELAPIFDILRAAHDVDFTHYRPSTIRRRILRRMVLNKAPTVTEYAELCRTRPLEVRALYQDILIQVTQFFRDAAVFERLSQEIFPRLFRHSGPDRSIRVWVPGCATGEEVYSIAITLLEVQAELGEKEKVPIHIFGTDVSDEALERARAGCYLENIAHDVSPERLRRFFVKVGKHYQINKFIREMCTFARQNLIRDPPFSRLDFISCRNVLIYFDVALQKQVIPIFHYALRPTGYLMLGVSETMGSLGELFVLSDKKSKVYAKKLVLGRPNWELAGKHPVGDIAPTSGDLRLAEEQGTPDLQEEANRVVMNRYAPPGVIVDSDLQIVQFRGHTGPYLEPAPGEASLNVLKMAREGLMLDLRAALQKARRSGARVRVDNVRLRSHQGSREVAIEVIPLLGKPERGGQERWFLVLFEELNASSTATARDKSKKKVTGNDEASRLARELAATKEYLQLTIEEQEVTHEELVSSNEELLSSNEELQSINEELQTAKEELTSANEELTTVNEELATRNAEHAQLNGDLLNLLASVSLPIVMLSLDLRIRRFTLHAERLLNLIAGDVGRPISDIKPKIEVTDLEQRLAEVIQTGAVCKRHAHDRDGRGYLMRIHPYRTIDNRIDGAVLMFIDIDGFTHGA